MTGSESDQPSSKMEVSTLLNSTDAKDEVPPSTPSSTSTDPSADAELSAHAKHKQFEMSDDSLPSDEERGFAESDQNVKAVDEEIPWDEVDRSVSEDTKATEDAALQGDQDGDFVEKQDETEESLQSVSSPTPPEKVDVKEVQKESTVQEGIVNDPSQSSSPSKSEEMDISKYVDESKEGEVAAGNIQEGPKNAIDISKSASQENVQEEENTKTSSLITSSPKTVED